MHKPFLEFLRSGSEDVDDFGIEIEISAQIARGDGEFMKSESVITGAHTVKERRLIGETV